MAVYYPVNNFGGNYFNPNLLSNTSNFGNTSNYVNTSNPQVGNQIVQNPVQTNDGFNNMHVPAYNNYQIPGMCGNQAQDFYTNHLNQILGNQGQNQAIAQDHRMVQNHPDQNWYNYDYNQAIAQNNPLGHQQNQPLAYQQAQNQAITQNRPFYNPADSQNHPIPSQGINRQNRMEPYSRKQQKVKNSKENCDFHCKPCGKWFRTDRHLKTCQKCE